MEDNGKLPGVVRLCHEYSKEVAVLKVLYERTTFFMKAPSELLTSFGGQSYRDLLDSYFNPMQNGKRDDSLSVLSSLGDFVVAPFQPTIETLAQPIDSTRPITLRDFTHSNHFHLSLSNANHVYFDKHTSGPTYDLLTRPIPSLQLPPTLSRIDASEVTFSQEDFDPSTPTLPITATVHGERRFFKPASNLMYPEFVQALFANVTLHRKGSPIPNIPRLEGIVTTSENPPSIAGFLTAWIDGMKLADTPAAMRQAKSPDGQAAVEETVQSLHGLGLTWGDVNAHNVMIDSSLRACVVDLGGGGQGALEAVEEYILATQPRQHTPNGDGERSKISREKQDEGDMRKELEAIGSMMSALYSLDPEDSQYLGPFFFRSSLGR